MRYIDCEVYSSGTEVDPPNDPLKFADGKSVHLWEQRISPTLLFWCHMLILYLELDHDLINIFMKQSRT